MTLDPNLDFQLAEEFVGGLELPSLAQAGFVPRVNVTGNNLEYPALIGPIANSNKGIDPITLEVRDNTDGLDYEIPLIATAYFNGTRTGGTALYVAATHTPADESLTMYAYEVTARTAAGGIYWREGSYLVKRIAGTVTVLRALQDSVLIDTIVSAIAFSATIATPVVSFNVTPAAANTAFTVRVWAKEILRPSA